MRITGAASVAGFTPMRTDAPGAPTGGLRRWWEWHALLPRLGLFDGREAEVPYDYTDVLRATAPRPLLIVAPTRDRDADFAAVQGAVAAAAGAWPPGGGAAAELRFEAPDGVSELSSARIHTVADWLRDAVAAAR